MVCALLVVPLVPTAAQATLSGVGPIDPGTSFPSYYSDSQGLRLELCLTNATICLTGADGLVPAHAAGGDGEAFYWAADATVAGITVHNALEASYAADGPNQEVVFTRTQIAANNGGVTPNGVYTVTDPFGTLKICTADATGTIKNNSCRIETTPVEGEFNRPLPGRIGPFLTWDTYGTTGVAAPPDGYIGDGQTPHKVVGSPTGFNKVRIVGPGVNGTATTADDCVGYTGTQQCAETSLFVVQGKVAPGSTTPPPVVTPPVVTPPVV
jgi:hypothetical protein